MQITKFLKTSPLIHTVSPTVEVLLDFFSKSHNQNHTLSLFYGETYDEYGVTIDSLKYYFVISLLHKYLESIGINVKSTIIEADVASSLNHSAQTSKLKLKQQTNYRLKLISKIIRTYHLPIHTQLMSNVFESSLFKEKLRIVNEFSNNQQAQSAYFSHLKQTVLKNKLSQEYRANFRYSQEAIATSLLFDVKIGPPREQFYDQAQSILARELELPQLKSIYLSPSYPLGQNFAFFLTHPEIEEYGLTPYKAGSNKLHENRIILNMTPIDQIERLIKNSFESSNKTAHPILDLYQIAVMANNFLENNFELLEMSTNKILSDIPSLKAKTSSLINQAIIQPLNNVKQ